MNHQPSAPLTLCLQLHQHGRNYSDINPGGLGREIDWRANLIQLALEQVDQDPIFVFHKKSFFEWSTYVLGLFCYSFRQSESGERDWGKSCKRNLWQGLILEINRTSLPSLHICPVTSDLTFMLSVGEVYHTEYIFTCTLYFL